MMDITNGIAGPYWVDSTQTSHNVTGRHGAIVRRYPLNMADAAAADAKRLQKLAIAAERKAAAHVERVRDAAPALRASLVELLDAYRTIHNGEDTAISARAAAVLATLDGGK